MASSTAELIKEKIDVVEFIRGYLPLQPAGRNFKALCPFHREKTASFMVSPDRQSWHCFGCAAGGDIFSFLMRYENIEFGEALRILAEKAGVELRHLNPAEYKLTGLLYDLQQTAKDFFKRELLNSDAARKYLKERGLSSETIETFELGWAPPGPEALTLHFLNAGVSPNDILQAGLALRTERGLLIDRFRGRIMFPIHNHFGKIAGFTGRVLPQFDTGETGKYVNSPETPIFNKSRILYGFWMSKNPIRDARSAFLVEGQMDFLMSWQAGVKNVVASSGTALTADHLRLLKRVADELVFSFDNDEAGWAAGERAIDLAQTEDFQVKVVTLDGVKDPAEAAQKNAAGFKRAVAGAKPAVEFYFARYIPDGTVLIAERAGLERIRAVLRKIKTIASPIMQNFWLKEFSRRTRIEEKVLAEEGERLVAGGSGSAAVPAEAAKTPLEETPRQMSRLEFISERLLSFVAASGDAAVAEKCGQYLTPRYAAALDSLRAGKKRSDDPEIDQILNTAFLRGGSVAREEAEELKKGLVAEYFKERRGVLARAVRAAEEKGDDSAVRATLNELRDIPHST